MDAPPPTVPQPSGTVEEVFKDYEARRTALVKALTTDIEDFLQKCDPEMENLCLYGHPNGNWEVCKPPEMVPGEFPEPPLGINFARDHVKLDDWVALVAIHSDAWLFALAFSMGSKYGFDKTERERLFDTINEVPTIFEVIRGTAKKPHKESSESRSKITTSKSKGKQLEVSQTKCEENEVDLVEEEMDPYAQCGGCDEYLPDEFWIGCDVCERWFHCSCVKMTPTMAVGIGKYECPICNNTKRRLELNL